jgi:hypothetical protein
MKKLLSRIIAIALIAILFTVPASAQAASYVPTSVYNSGDFRMYQFDPYKSISSSTDLVDLSTTNQQWFVPAGQRFDFSCIFKETCTFTAYIFQNDQISLTLPMTAQNFDNTFTPKSFDAYYKIVIVPSSTNVSIDTYYGMWSGTQSYPNVVSLAFDENTKLFQYQPSKYNLSTNQSTALIDTDTLDGWWSVPAGKQLSIDIGASGNFRIFIYKLGSGLIKTETLNTTGGFLYNIPAQSSSAKYLVCLQSLSNTSLNFYGQYIQ